MMASSYANRHRYILFWCVVALVCLLGASTANAQTDADQQALVKLRVYISKGDYEGAVKAGRIATEEMPQNAEAWLLYGRAQFEVGNFDDAEAALSKVDTLTDKHPILIQTFDLLGNIYLVSQGELEKAQDAFQKQMAYTREDQDRPGEALAHYNLGQVFSKRGAHAEALNAYGEALQFETRYTQRALYQAALAEELILTDNTTRAISNIEIVAASTGKILDVKAKSKICFSCGQLYTLAGERERGKGVANSANLALDYFKKADAKLQEGFKLLRSGNVEDFYTEAVGYRLFGNLVAIQGNVREALNRYQQALQKVEQTRGHIELIYDLRARIAELRPLARNREYLFGTIDIGSKGVKAFALSIRTDSKGEIRSQELYRRSINTDLNASMNGNNGNFSAKAIQDTANAVRTLINEMQATRQTPFNRIMVAGSSSLGLARNRPELAKRIFQISQDLPGAPAHSKNATAESATPFISNGDELFYGIVGSIPKEDRKDAFLVDIGSGNGRLGYIWITGKGRTPVSLEIRLGSVSLANLARKNMLPTDDYATSLEREAEKQVGEKLRNQLRVNPQVVKYSKVYIEGGAAYALVTLLHPEAAMQDYVVLSHDDLIRFYDLVKAATEEKPYVPDLTGIANADVREVAQKQITNLLKTVFNRDQLLAAAILLKTLEKNVLKPSQTLIFPRMGNWAVGRVLDEYLVHGIEEQ